MGLGQRIRVDERVGNRDRSLFTGMLMKFSVHPMGLIGLLGGLGGMINAWLYYTRLVRLAYAQFYGRASFPSTVKGLFLWPGSLDMNIHGVSWVMIPAGAIYGGLLALSTAYLVTLLWKRKLIVRCSALPFVGTVTGWIGCLGLWSAYAELGHGHLGMTVLWRFWFWNTEMVIAPYLTLGLVGVIYYTTRY